MDERLARGMAAQLELRRRRLDGGDAPLGWKVGFGAPEMMEKLAIDGALVGFLTRRAVLASGASLALSDFTKMAVEPEIAVHMGADLAAGSDRTAARAAIAGLAPAIEIADATFPPVDAEQILAANIYQRHVVLGDLDTSRAGARLEGLNARVSTNGDEVANTSDLEVNTGNIIDTVRHVADTLGQIGETLRAGEIIIAGSIVPPFWIDAAQEFEFALDPLGTISLKIVD